MTCTKVRLRQCPVTIYEFWLAYAWIINSRMLNYKCHVTAQTTVLWRHSETLSHGYYGLISGQGKWGGVVTGGVYTVPVSENMSS